MRKYIFLLLPTILLAGCSDLGDPVNLDESGDDPGEVPTSFSEDLRPILDMRCTSCHMQGNAQGGLVLSEGESPDNLLDVESTGYAPDFLVQAGSRNSSVLYLKLAGDAAYGSTMPLGSTLDSSEIELFGRWIDEGAQDN